MRTSIVAVALVTAGCGAGGSAPVRVSAKATAAPDATDVNREAKAPVLVHVYKTLGDDPYPWTLTVRTDNTANLVIGGGHGGGQDRVVVLTRAQTQRTARLVAAVPWKRVADHTVDPGGFGGNDNMARYMLRHRNVSTVFAAGDMPRSMARLTHMLDRIIDGDIGRSVASDSHFSSNGGVLPSN